MFKIVKNIENLEMTEELGIKFLLTLRKTFPKLTKGKNDSEILEFIGSAPDSEDFKASKCLELMKHIK